MILIILLTISPYLIRNMVVLDTITITKSLGYNLWKGNNELSSVEGYSGIDDPNFENLKYKLEILTKDNFYELNRDNIFLREAIAYVFLDSAINL